MGIPGVFCGVAKGKWDAEVGSGSTPIQAGAGDVTGVSGMARASLGFCPASASQAHAGCVSDSLL